MLVGGLKELVLPNSSLNMFVIETHVTRQMAVVLSISQATLSDLPNLRYHQRLHITSNSQHGRTN
jgi:hypothetical protein